MLNDLATIAQNKIQINLPGERVTFEKITQPTILQQKALDLLGVSLIVPSKLKLLNAVFLLTDDGFTLLSIRKFRKKRNQENLPVHSFSTLLNDLATIAQNKIQINLPGERVTFEK